jgi:hypothetical protein
MTRIAAAGLLMLFAGTTAPATGQHNCAGAIVEFRGIIETENQMGHVNHAAKNRLQRELSRIEETCRAGRNADALRALAALRSRHGYR